MCFERVQLELKLQRDRLKQYKKRIHGIMERETEIAKQLLKGRAPSRTHAFVPCKRSCRAAGLWSLFRNRWRWGCVWRCLAAVVFEVISLPRKTVGSTCRISLTSRALAG